MYVVDTDNLDKAKARIDKLLFWLHRNVLVWI